MPRRRFKQTKSLEERLAEEATELRRVAEMLPPGPTRERVLRRARQDETAIHMQDWLRSPGLKASNLETDRYAQRGCCLLPSGGGTVRTYAEEAVSLLDINAWLEFASDWTELAEAFEREARPRWLN
jgi:hypothetical protein